MNAYERRQKIIELLDTRKRMTVSELSAALNVSERTIHRDIVSLSDGSRIYTTPGRTGGVFVLPSYKTSDTPKFSVDDVNVLKKLQSATNQRICFLSPDELVSLEKMIAFGVKYLT